MERVKGFTLIELMVTLVVAGILLGIAIPSFQNFIIDSRLNTTATELADAVRIARSEALKRNRPILFCRIDPDDPEECDSGDSWSGWAVLDDQMDDGEKTLRLGQINSFGNTVQVSSDLSNQSAVFAGDGLARTGAGAGSLINAATITICSTSGSGDKTREVIFGAAGRVSIVTVAGGCE